ncbi:MAG: DnaD domain protein [Clostridia bacterium]|nr:DnaD domain protein [Clostridia bacterium]
MAEKFELGFDFVEKWGRFAKPEYFRIYVYILAMYKKDKTVFSFEELADILDIRTHKVKSAIEYWQAEGFLSIEGNSYVFTEKPSKEEKKDEIRARVSSRPSYTHTEIDKTLSKNKEMSYLFSQSEKIMGKLLSSNDMEILYSFVDWLSLPVEVIIMIINYAVSVDKGNMRYIEKVAIDWADREINTYEKAEEYVKELEAIGSKARKICKILGISGRALSTTEKKYIDIWTTEKDIPLDLIPIAYDKTMLNTGGKKGWLSYMDKILSSWHDAGIRTQEELEKAEAHYRVKQEEEGGKPLKKGANKFSNYNDTNKIDYKKYAEQVLSDMLDE